MLEKIGLPVKPSMRGGNWVLDASHCQGCSSQFTFINRKHHCRRCGGLFCNGCTQQRMTLRGQGDAPVRICDPCKKIEEAARFELRYGHKSRAAKGSSKHVSKNDDETLLQFLEEDAKRPSTSAVDSRSHTLSDLQRARSSGEISNLQEASVPSDEVGDIIRSISANVQNNVLSEVGSSSPEELLREAAEEKNKYKILKGEGKSKEALLAYKRAKELERQAGALEIAIRKSRRLASNQKTSGENEAVVAKKKIHSETNKTGKDDLAHELRELGWSDADLHETGKKPLKPSLESELSGILGEIPQKSRVGKGSGGIDKTQVLAHKKNALALKREGKLAEAKEELKLAKILEKQLEEQEHLAEADDSEDEISALIRSMDDEEDDKFLDDVPGPSMNFDHFARLGDDITVDADFDVTDGDMNDPDIVAALKSFGWREEDDHSDEIVLQSAPKMDSEKIAAEVLSLKREALNQKRAGNLAEAMELLKKAKLLERDIDTSQEDVKHSKPEHTQKTSTLHVSGKVPIPATVANESLTTTEPLNLRQPPRSKLVLQRELLALKKKALALRREGRMDEAEQELQKGKALELQLEEIENAPKVANADTRNKNVWEANSEQVASVASNLAEEDEDTNVTEEDMEDPALLSVLENLGWKDDTQTVNVAGKASMSPDVTKSGANLPAKPMRSKGEIQRELLAIKRKAFALRRQGKMEEAEEELKMAQDLENQLDVLDGKSEHVEKIYAGFGSSVPEKKPESLISTQDAPKSDGDRKDISSLEQIVHDESLKVPAKVVRSKAEIQKELLSIKRKALALRRQGKMEEAEEELVKAKDLENQLAEMEVVPSSHSTEEKSGDFGSLATDRKSESLVTAGNVSKDDGDMLSLLGNVAPKGEYTMVEALDTYPIRGNHQVEPPLVSFDADINFSDEQKLHDTMAILPLSNQQNLMDLLTGDAPENLPIPETKHEEASHSYGIASLVPLGSSNFDKGTASKKDSQSLSEEFVKKMESEASAGECSPGNEADLPHGLDSLKDQVLAHKRKALALKREGKLAEAREELAQAKLLERSLHGENKQANEDSKTSPPLTSVGNPVVQKPMQDSTSPPKKPISSRDRFKLQQESLAHKRQALKLRREGKMEESEVEFELAKKLEAQIEELDNINPNKNKVEDDAMVEDLLDPQLMSALKSIGWDASDIVTHPPQKSEAKSAGKSTTTSKAPLKDQTLGPPQKLEAKNTDTSSPEKTHIEEQIKVEKVRALNLKRSGKQAEALEALRSAKRLEKKLASLG